MTPKSAFSSKNASRLESDVTLIVAVPAGLLPERKPSKSLRGLWSERVLYMFSLVSPKSRSAPNSFLDDFHVSSRLRIATFVTNH